MRILDDVKLDFDDVLLVPQETDIESREDVNLIVSYKFRHSPRTWSGIPIICSNMACVATQNMATSLARHKMITCLSKYIENQQMIGLLKNAQYIQYIWPTIGFRDTDIVKLQQLCDNIGYEPNICIDVPNGYLICFTRFCEKIRKLFPKSILMAGNVTTKDGAITLIQSGVDIVKCQIGPGRACQTRVVTGVGYGTLSCIEECASINLENTHICSDGGCRATGDISKALAAGASFVMIGSLLAGTDQCSGEWETAYELLENKITGREIKKYLVFYGMSTHLAQGIHENVKKPYRASEGTCIKIPYKGDVDTVIQEILGGIRSTCSYLGARNLQNISDRATFVRVNKIHSYNTPDFGVNGV